MDSSPHLRALAAADLPAARALIGRSLWHPGHIVAAAQVLESAAVRPSEEARGIAATDAAGLAGFILYGLFAGAQGAGRLHLVVTDERVRRHGIATRLINECIAALEREHARLIVAEMPAGPDVYASSHRLLTTAGFSEEAQISDFFSQGVALSIRRRDLAAT